MTLRLSAMTAVTGYERAMVDTLLTLLPGAVRDRAGNAVLTFGSGEPRRLVACPIDETGFIVGGIRPDGYLSLRRVGRPGTPLFDQQLEGQRITVFGRRGPLPGVVAVRSVHLSRGRGTNDEPFTVDNAFVDIGAASREEAIAAGAVVLSPVALEKRPHRYGAALLASPGSGRRAACAALLAAASLRPASQGQTVVAFTVAQRLSAGALQFVANARGPFQQTLVVDAGAGAPGQIRERSDSTGQGSLGRVSRWTLPVRYAETAAETVALSDATILATMIRRWISGQDSAPVYTHPAAPSGTMATADVTRSPTARGGELDEAETVLARLVESYGVSGMEAPVRDVVKNLLPAWARTETDTAGNLWLRLGKGEPLVVFVAHLDEIGFQVTRIRDDGSLELQPRGGFFSSLFEARPALLHTGDGIVPGVFTPRDSVATPVRRTPEGFRVDVGAASRAEAEAMGIRPGAMVTMPKSYRRLLGNRATGRSFDDRVGCAAQVLAVRRIDPARLRHSVVFVWSVREEIGLEGAQAAARSLGLSAARVHAIDTFVSADTPLELPNFGVAPLGQGAVARATDNSSITPPAYVDSLVTLARTQRIALQVGTTNGGNDGSTFAEFGVPDVAIGWPLRYAHSPAEVIDLGDVVSLSDLIRTIAERW